MKTETFSGKVETAYGQTLSKAIPVSGTYEAFESIEEVRAKNEYPSDKDVLNFVNSRAKQNARAAATTAALEAAGIAKPTLESPEFRLKEMVKVLVASGKSEAEAEQIAKTVLG